MGLTLVLHGAQSGSCMGLKMTLHGSHNYLNLGSAWISIWTLRGSQSERQARGTSLQGQSPGPWDRRFGVPLAPFGLATVLHRVIDISSYDFLRFSVNSEILHTYWIVVSITCNCVLKQFCASPKFKRLLRVSQKYL